MELLEKREMGDRVYNLDDAARLQGRESVQRALKCRSDLESHNRKIYLISG